MFEMYIIPNINKRMLYTTYVKVSSDKQKIYKKVYIWLKKNRFV